ncbi:right-handed parallel beta-helix repeat-containing protein [Actinacidiphila acididurans]|uniref:Right-handed parallel beta-helix repeat-containing protein n=1 Tax=Actinacidiphila acididurans TaxID=2784346 RepID=A0ABS2TIY9_9ACTN|nr:right-handed parallel beta-helix repeat-containing protein [Actinacidiphila acididurans]MBM9503309.1 right-handed parallel beta-helix repeat-containing protein [Actinacidiphila acididurans]
MRRAVLACLVAVAAATLGVSGGGSAQAASHATDDVLHVAPDGRGSACTTTSPCTLDTARDQARALVPGATGDVVVELQGGTYRLTGPFRLGVQDSGRPGHPVVYRAAAGQKPVLTGAMKVTGFTRVDAARNIYRADVPAGTASRELFVNGVRADRDRGPRDPSGFSVTPTGFHTADSSYTTWTDPARVEVVRNSGWKQMRCPLASIKPGASGGSDLTVDPACWNNNHTSVPNPSFPFNGAGLPTLDGITWLENAYQLLGTPGQFYLDQDGGHLYYVPRPGEDLATADVELPVASELVDAAGTPGHLAPLNDTDWRAVYTGSWGYSSGRHLGDLNADVHYTSTDGDSVSYTFDGTGIQMLSETNDDEGSADVYVDGKKVSTVSANGPVRLAQQALVSVTGLTKGTHTLRVVKTGGTYLLVDGFTVIPDAIASVHDITFSGITFTGTTWTAPTAEGYVDNQAGVIWDPTTRTPARIPAAVQVHRGQRVTFTGDTVTHTGTSGIDLADQTQDSTVTGSTITDTSGIGVAVGEVDDYYQTEPALMTSGNTVSGSVVQFPGQEYADAVGIWVGYSRGTTLSHNDVGYTPYSGISIGWGWGWASDCTLQAKQGLPNPCLHGTTYAGDEHVVGNHVHSVMGALYDGGPVYTLGGEALPSEFTGNVLSECIDGCNMIYHDEGSSLWNTHDNVVRFANGSLWLNLWTPSIHDDSIHDNWSDTPSYNNNGTNISLQPATVVTDGNWPAAAQAIVATAGPGTLPGAAADDDDLRVAYHGSWSSSGSRGLGDLDNGVHYTQQNGASATITFTGTGIGFLTETNSDEGDIGITLDGASKGTISADTPQRQTQQSLYSVSGLTDGPHTLTVTKLSGTYLLVDGFTLS